MPASIPSRSCVNHPGPSGMPMTFQPARRAYFPWIRLKRRGGGDQLVPPLPAKASTAMRKIVPEPLSTTTCSRAAPCFLVILSRNTSNSSSGSSVCRGSPRLDHRRDDAAETGHRHCRSCSTGSESAAEISSLATSGGGVASESFPPSAVTNGRLSGGARAKQTDLRPREIRMRPY